MEALIKKLLARKKGYITKQAALKLQLKEVNKKIQDSGFSDLHDLHRQSILFNNAMLLSRMAELDYVLKQLR